MAEDVLTNEINKEVAIDIESLLIQLGKDHTDKVVNTPFIASIDIGTLNEINLSHVGVLGMKWGVRRQTSAGGVVRSLSKSSKYRSEDFIQSRAHMKKSPKKLSNDDIKNLTERLQLEKKLRELKTSDRTKGLAVVKTLTSVGTTLSAAYAVSQTPAGRAFKNAMSDAVKNTMRRRGGNPMSQVGLFALGSPR